MQLKNKNILIVEDNSSNRIVYRIIMSRTGANVMFDSFGCNTLNLVQQHETFDLIILDLMLGTGQDGYSICEEIRALPDYEDVPIVVVSASDPSSAIPRAQEAGFSGFISKPIHDDKFAQQLSKLLDGEKIWDTGTY